MSTPTAPPPASAPISDQPLGNPPPYPGPPLNYPEAPYPPPSDKVQHGYGTPPPPAPAYSQPYYPPQPYGHPVPPGYSQGSSTVVTTQPTIVTTTVIAPNFKESPTTTICPHCQAQVLTNTQFEAGTFAWIICAVVCIIGCDLGCCLIPFCLDSCKDVIHECPNCRRVIHRWNRL